MFDEDSNGKISLEEFKAIVHHYANEGEEEKIEFLFKIFDPNGDGIFELDELKEIMKACVMENGMDLDTQQIEHLTQLFYEDSVKPGQSGIGRDDLKEQFRKHSGLLQNLKLPFNDWLEPKKEKQTSCLRNIFRVDILNWAFIQKNIPFISFFVALLSVNLALFIDVFQSYKHLLKNDPSFIFYPLARSFGAMLLFNSVLVLVVVLRHTITTLRNLGLSLILPLDTHIYFHKVVGRMIFFLSILHTISHLLFCTLCVAPEPVKNLQILYGSDWMLQGFQVPDGCEIVLLNSNLSSFCSNETVFLENNIDGNITHCLGCQSGQYYNLVDWMFTTKPGVFGLIGGYANPSGIALMVIISIITICSMSFVRRTGNFQVFYISHLLYWVFWVLMIIHCPKFWKWFIVFGIIFIVEKAYRMLSFFIGRGQTVIDEGIPLASKVTYLKIRKLPRFNYSPGDWCFIKVYTF